MPSWVMSRKLELGVGLAGGERCRRSVSVRVTHPVLRRDLVMHLIHERSGSGAEAA
jgi:hypothetical protein